MSKLGNGASAALHSVVQQSSKYTCLMGDRKGSTPEYISCLWVGWLLQHQIIDVPARQGVLIWDEVCQVGMWGYVPATTCTSLTFVLSVTNVCNVEGCGLFANVLNLLVK
jgi:hypothetical protein